MTVFTGGIQVDSVDNKHRPTDAKSWKKDICVERTIVEFKLDSGAEVSILPYNIFNTINGGYFGTGGVTLGQSLYFIYLNLPLE